MSAERGGAARPPRLAVMISGGGRTLMNLADEIDAGRLDAEIALVVASRDCPGVERAQKRGLPTRIVEGDVSRETLQRLLDDARVDWVALGGYLRLLDIPERYQGRVVNIHPALLPKFGGPRMFGERVHRAVLEAGEKESGCTVHLCDAGYDTGPIVLQMRCPVLADDTPQTLAQRVFELEKRAYPEALRRLFAEQRRRAEEL